METDMTGRIPKGAAKLAAAIFAATALLAVAAGTAGAEVVYNNIPSPLPGNFASIGLAATSSSEFGGEVEVAGTARKNPVVTVVMSSWTCESGTVASNCVTSPSKPKTFKVPVTVRMYGAGELGEGPLAARTTTVKMKYRPSSEPVKCPADASGGRWYDAATAECSHGYAFPITIKSLKTKRMPKKVIITVSYPHATPQTESLNISVSEPWENLLSPPVGVGVDPVAEWVVNSTWSGMYGSTGTVGVLGLEGGLNSVEGGGTEYQPVIGVSAS
jgi:hypothetical protein